MFVDVIEFEVTCSGHGSSRMLVPVEHPWPEYCPHCFLRLTSRREARRFSARMPVAGVSRPESWVG